MARLRQVDGADLPRGLGEELALLDEVTREKQRKGDLGHLTRLKAERSKVNPNTAPTVAAANKGKERQQEHADPGRRERPLIFHKVIGVLYDEQRDDVRNHAHHRPAGLL